MLKGFVVRAGVGAGMAMVRTLPEPVVDVDAAGAAGRPMTTAAARR